MTTREHSLASPGNAWAPGHRIEHFELQQVASSRSGAIVYRGWDHRLARAVAVKEFLPARLARRGPGGDVVPAGDTEAVHYARGLRAFIEEARLLAHADAPTLVRVVELVEVHGTAYRVMPWHDGVPLADLRRGMAGPPDEAAVRRLLDELLVALAAWHRSVGVHGAVDPGQVMLLDDDRALLLGPGLARRAVASDAVEALMRQLEPCYAPPELVDPQPEAPPGPWSDFYALSQTVRYAITGLPPPPAGGLPVDPLGPAYEHLFPQARPLAADLAQALDRAASPRIADRPQVAAQWRQALALQPAPPPPERPPLTASEEATATLIQRVIESIPDLPPPLPRPAPPAPQPVVEPPPGPIDIAIAPQPAPAPAAPEPDFSAADHGRPAYSAMPPRRPARRGRRAMLGVLALVLAAAGYSVWTHYAGAPAPEGNPMVSLSAALQPAPPVASPTPAERPAPLAAAPEPAPPPTVVAQADPPAARSEPPPAPAPAAPPPVVAVAPAERQRARAAPRQACAGRTEFALYRCMQQQCAKPAQAKHAQCVRFKRTDRVD